jgi:superfamily II DNA/RNA helicase
VRYADVVVATPGRLIDLMERHALTLNGVEIAVIDEADHMADLGFMPAVTRIMDDTPADGQRMFFSATLDKAVSRLVTAYVADPALHAVAPVGDATPAEHQVLILAAQDKLPVAAEIAGRPGRTLFFVRTKHGADRLAKQLSRAGVDAAAIHGDRNQSQRQRALDGFTAGHPRVLVATNVAARGIHVDDVDLVVQFDPPNDPKDYLHRSGRTARAGATGLVVALVEQSQLRELEKLHAEAGVTAVRHQVESGHEVVREIAASGTPVPPAPVPVPQASSDRPARSGQPARPGRPSRAGRAAKRARAAAGQHGAGTDQSRPPRRPQDSSPAGDASPARSTSPTRNIDRSWEPGPARNASRSQGSAQGRDSGRPQHPGRSQRAGQDAGAGGSGRPGRPGKARRAA